MVNCYAKFWKLQHKPESSCLRRGGGEKRKKKKEEKPSEDIASKIALPIAVTAGAALAICAGVFGVNKALGGGKKVVGETVEKTAGTVKETAKKANKTIQEQQQEISKILRNLQADQKFTKDEATQLTQYLTAYTSALTLGGYQGINIDNYTKLINNFIKNINKKFKDPSVNETLIAEENDPLIQDINNINNMFDQIENLVKSQNQSSEINQNIEKINIEVEEEKEPESPVEPVQNPVAKFEFVDNKYKQGSFLQNLNVEKLSYLDLQHIACCRLQDNTHVLVIDSNDLKLDKTPDEASSVKFDDVEVNAYLYKLEDTMPPSDMTTLLGNSRITSALVSETDANFLQQYLTNQAGKVSGATDQDLKAMINLTTKVTSVLKSTKGIGDDVKANISNANTNLIKAIQQKQLNAKLKAFDDDKDSSKLFDNFASLKTLISTYNLEANSIYYIDSNNEWKKVEEKVPDNAKFVIEVKDPTTDFTITKKDTYCELTYDKDGHITVKATPAKKYIDIITADEKSLKQNVPDLKCTISDDDKKTALKNLKDLLQNNDDFKEAYKTARGDKKYNEDFKPVGGGIFKNSSGGILTQLLNADLDTAIKLLTPTKKNKDILAALNTATITSDTYTDQSALTAAINKTPYLKEMLTSSTIPTKLPLFSGDTQEEYIKKIDGNTTVYTVKDNPSKKYTVECSSSSNEQNTVTIKFDDKTYAYTVSEAKCELPEKVPKANKDLFEHFVYMALQNDSTKQKAFALNLLRQIKLDEMVKKVDGKITEGTKALQKKVLRLIMAAADKTVQEAAEKILSYASSKDEGQAPTEQIYIDKKHNITKDKTKETLNGYIRIHIGGTPKRLLFASSGLFS